MAAAIFLGLVYCALPTLVFGLLRPATVSMGRWPTTRWGVLGLAITQAFVGMMGLGAFLQPEKPGLVSFDHDISIAIAVLCGLSALSRLVAGRSDEPTKAEAVTSAASQTSAGNQQCEPAADLRCNAGSSEALDNLPADARRDMRSAVANVGKLRRWADIFDGHVLQGILSRIADLADATIQEVSRDPGDFPRVRKALVHYLGHVVAVLDQLATIHVGTGREEHLNRAAGTLERLLPIFESYRSKAFENDAIQLDARLDMLDQEIVAHGRSTPVTAGS